MGKRKGKNYGDTVKRAAEWVEENCKAAMTRPRSVNKMAMQFTKEAAALFVVEEKDIRQKLLEMQADRLCNEIEL